MVRRWLIRSVAILICAVCVGSFLAGTIFPVTATFLTGAERVFCVEWIGSRLVAFSNYRPGNEQQWYLDWPTIDSHRFESWRAAWDDNPHFAGFGGFTFHDAYPGSYYIRLPLWFIALLSVLLLLWIFRRTRTKAPPAAFPVEATQAVQKS